MPVFDMTAEEWNARFPIGTKVIYFPIRGEVDRKEAVTRSLAWNLGHGMPVAKITGQAGGVFLNHLLPLVDGICRECGCSDDDACQHDELGSCCWIEANLCSFCFQILRNEMPADEILRPVDRIMFCE